MKNIITKITSFIIIVIITLLAVGCTGTNSTDTNTDIVKIIDVKLTDEQYAFVCKKGNTALVEGVNSFISEIKVNGTFDALVAKYFEGNGTKIGYTVTTSDVENTDKNLIVVTNCPFEPFEYMDVDGKIYGLDIEIAAAYAEYAGLELIIKNIGFDEIFTQVEAGYADIGMAGITASADRAEIYDFTVPYYEASQKIIVSYANPDFDNSETAEDIESIIHSLIGKSIGYQSATTGGLYINGDADWGYIGFKNVEGKAYANAQTAITDLINGNIYAVILDEAPAQSIVKAINSQQDTTKFNWIAKFKNFFSTLSNEYYLEVFFKGLTNTVIVAVIGLVIGILIGTVIAIVKVAPKYKCIYRILDKICNVYVTIFRGTPIVAQLLIAYYVIIPSLNLKLDALSVGCLVFGMNSGAYVSEMMRGGLNSVDKGQMEAGRALGLTYATTMIKIIVPQAVKNILPTLGNEFISLIKETSVLSFIAVYDLYKALLDVGMVKYDSMVPYLMMGLIYIVLVLIISAGIKIIERRFAKSDRN